MIQDFDGRDVVGPDGNKIGSVDQTYVDDSGEAQFVEVKTGALFGKHKLIPVDSGELTDNGLQVPYTKDVVDGSPDIPSSADEIEGELLERVREYYAGAGPNATTGAGEAAAVPVSEGSDVSDTASRQQASADIASTPLQENQQVGTARDLGDVIEVPIIEEVLVKKPVVREVVRIRKRQSSETRAVGAELRKEDLEVDASEGVMADKGPDDQ